MFGRSKEGDRQRRHKKRRAPWEESIDGFPYIKRLNEQKIPHADGRQQKTV
jgi:hypothetical protein